ncbi:MAG TPA: GDSL-type esterase/lipase family protein [Candidatus Angelobacter sp.]|jgi:lysophospholipase L1-like esterase|nr:GDSL-type esterase/lipase family protein [Candidatus Angelobacter sp.]
MRSHLINRLRATAVAVGVTATLAFSLSGGAPASAGDGAPYLALGDSVVFGYITHDAFAYVNPDNFIGYPQVVGAARHLDVSNAACPGEATGGFISSTGTDNGCRTFRAHFPLHVSYPGTQEAYALAFLGAHPNTKLVSVSLGANDLFVLQSSCAAALNPPLCIANGLSGALGTIAANMNSILGAIRATGFHGTLVVVNYYSLDYADAAGTGLTGLLNGALTGTAAAHGAVVADVFSAFQGAATPAGGHTCVAGLLNGSPSNPTGCDVHPSITGQNLIAQTVLRTFDAARAGD